MDTDQIIDDLLERLSSLEHARWARWQAYMHSKGSILPDGSLKIPRELVEHWQRQIDTPYEDLSEREKESDREQVREYLGIIKDALR